jgi:hypothetical protein
LITEATTKSTDVTEATHGGGRLPEFVMIGAMKSGTTSLHRTLNRHPQIYMCPSKEPMFFSREAVYQRGIDWYRRQFAGAQSQQICGEASTCYSRWPHFGNVPARLHEHMPDAKLIYMMRHPVERAYSHYGHDMRHHITMSFEQALEEDKSIIDASLYMRQIEHYLEYFPRRQILFLILDDFRDHPDHVIEQIETFLCVDQIDLLQDGGEVANRAGDSMLHNKVKGRFKAIRQWPLLRQVADFCPYRMRRWILQTAVNRTIDSPVGKRVVTDFKSQLAPLCADSRQRLLEVFAAPTSELEKFLGRQLPEWRQ